MASFAPSDLATTSRPLVWGAQTQTDVTSMFDADNFTWTYGYDSNGDRNSVIEPLGNTTTYVSTPTAG